MIIDVYVDLVFGVNLGINVAVLVLANVLGRRGAKWWRIALGGAASALLYILLLFSPLRGLLNVFTSFIVLAPGVVVAFSFKGVRHFMANIGLSYICAFALGGLTLLTTNVFGGHTMQTADFATVNVTPLNLLVTVVISFTLIRFTRRYITNKTLDRKVFCKVCVITQHGVANFQALVDTGMTLTEPIGQNPVIVAEITPIITNLPEPVAQLFAQNLQDDLEAVQTAFIAADWHTRFRLIPFKTIGQQSGVLVGFRPDHVTIDNKEVSNAIIAITPHGFTLSNCGEFQGLINPLLYNEN